MTGYSYFEAIMNQAHLDGTDSRILRPRLTNGDPSEPQTGNAVVNLSTDRTKWEDAVTTLGWTKRDRIRKFW
jgi:hypothetical protein